MALSEVIVLVIMWSIAPKKKQTAYSKRLLNLIKYQIK